MPISRQSYLSQHPEARVEKQFIVNQSQGLPDSMLNQEQPQFVPPQYDNYFIEEITEEQNFVEEIPIIGENQPYIIETPQQNIAAMSRILAQNISTNQFQQQKPAPRPPMPPSAVKTYVPQDSYPLPQYQQEEFQEPHIESDEEYAQRALTDPTEPLYVLNMSNQIIFFTHLFGNEENDSPRLGTIDRRDPNLSANPYMVIPVDLKSKALSNHFFDKYLRQGVIKVVPPNKYYRFIERYEGIVRDAYRNRQFIEQYGQSENTMITMGTAGSPNPQQQAIAQYYQQQQMRQYGGAPPREELIIGGSPGLVDPYEAESQHYMQQLGFGSMGGGPMFS